MQADDFEAAISRLLRDHGIADFYFTRRRKHPAVMVRSGSAYLLHTYAGTPGDHRGLQNNLSDLRHKLGLVGKQRPAAGTVQKKARRKSPRKSAPCSVKLGSEPAPPREDRFHAPLAALKERMLREGCRETPPSIAPFKKAKQSSKVIRLRTPFLGRRIWFQEEIDGR